MKQFTFNYMQNFKCIADKCGHSCCEKWTVNIDKRSIKKYKKIKSNFSFRIKDGIDFKGRTFKMTADGRCAFLNEKNLCDIIINQGESYLCQVCSDHPRFRSFFDGRVETGLGLCCEEASRIMLTSNDKMNIISLDDKKEKLSKKDKQILSWREGLISVVQDRNLTINQRLNKIIQNPKICNFLSEYKKYLFCLEVNSNVWIEHLNIIDNFDNVILDGFNPIIFEQLLSYFIFRHVSSIDDEFDLQVQVLFSVLSTLLILIMSKRLNIDVTEIAREYSVEIEYSENNLANIKDFIERNHRLGKI